MGEKWIVFQPNLDAMLAHVTDELKSHAGKVAGLRVLDIGCGTGETRIHWLEGGAHFAMQVGPAGWASAEANDELRAQSAQRIKAALTLFEKNGLVTLGGTTRREKLKTLMV